MSTTVRDDRRLTICKNNNANTISRETVDYFLQNELVKTMVSARCRPGLTKPSDDITGKSDIVWGRSYWFPDPKWLLGSCLWAKYNPYSGNISHHLFPKDHGHLIFREVDGLSFFFGGGIFFMQKALYLLTTFKKATPPHYTDLMSELGKAIDAKLTRKRKKEILFHQGNFPVHNVFWAWLLYKLLVHPPYSPDSIIIGFPTCKKRMAWN